MKTDKLFRLVIILMFLFFIVVGISTFFKERNDAPKVDLALQSKCAWLKHRADEDLVYTELALVKPRLQFPLTAEFKDIDKGIEDTDAATISVAGHVVCKNAFGVPNEATFAAVFKADSLGRDSVISFKMR